MTSIRRALLGILALVVIVICANWLMRLTSLGNKRLDLTDDKLHTLSEGTKEILTTLDAPVVLRYYATRNSEGIPREFELYMRRVDDFLAEYSALAGKNIRIENLDPEPDTDAEDSANLDGVIGQRLSEYDNFYFGISISCLDKKSVLPFINPKEETLLEYQLSNAIAEVAQPKKPVIGIMSDLQLQGAAAIPGRQARTAPSWIIYDQLRQTYDVKTLPLTAAEIPKDITTLIVIHPADITPKSEFLLDQFILGGGNIIALVDPISLTSERLAANNPMHRGSVTTDSSLPTLFKHWGIDFTQDKVVADGKYRSTLQGGRIAAGLLSLDKKAFVQKDELLTRSQNDLFLVFSGGFTHSGSGDFTYTPLATSSKQAYLVDPEKASSIDQSLIGMKPDGKTYDFVARLQGSFTTAFPDGDPMIIKAESSDGKDSEKEIAAEENKVEEPSSLVISTSPGSVFLISDVDFIYDQFAFNDRGTYGKQRIVESQNGNAALFLSMLDQTVGSSSLIGARSRASSHRPFSRIQEMKNTAEEKVGAKIREFKEKREQAQQRLNALQAEKTGADKLFLSPEQEDEIRQLKEQKIEFRKKIRNLQKDLKSEMDDLEGWLIILNVIVMPVIVGAFGLIYLRIRSKKTRAA